MSSYAKSQHCTVLAADTIYIGDGQRPDCSSIVLMMRTVRNQQCRQKLMFDFSLFCFSPVQQYINTKEQKNCAEAINKQMIFLTKTVQFLRSIQPPMAKCYSSHKECDKLNRSSN